MGTAIPLNDTASVGCKLRLKTWTPASVSELLAAATPTPPSPPLLQASQRPALIWAECYHAVVPVVVGGTLHSLPYAYTPTPLELGPCLRPPGVGERATAFLASAVANVVTSCLNLEPQRCS